MLSRMEMSRRMLVWRRVATADVAANHAKPQVHPTRANTDAVFTALRAGGYLLNLLKVGTDFSHNEVNSKW